MIDSFFDILRSYPAIAIFLTIGLGFFLGRLKIKGFQLGSVTSVLLVGVIVGQIVIPVPGPMKAFFFMLFLFSIGYNVGPDFFKSLRGSGAKQALFAVLMSGMCFCVTLAISFLMGYSKGETVGLFSGSQTCSSLLGVGTEAIQKLGFDAEHLKRELDIIPVCYAVTYIFGTLGTVVILGNFGPRLLGGLEYVKRRTEELEAEYHKAPGGDDPALVKAGLDVHYRAYRVENDAFATPMTIRDAEQMLLREGLEVCIDAVRHEGEISAPRHDDLVRQGDEVVVCGRVEYMIDAERHFGAEIRDVELLTYPLARVGVVVVKKDFIGKTILELREEEYMTGVVIRDASRHGRPIPITYQTKFEKGDRLTVLGREDNVYRASAEIGHVDRPSNVSDLMFVGLAIFIGGLFGALTLWVKGIPLSFGTSGGALLAGLIFGWWRSKRPTFGHIPQGALWVMNNLGLNVFIAIVGIEAAPSFVSGLQTVGPLLFAVGALGTMVPVFFGLWLGHKVFRFNPAITLGCCAGTRTCTAALGAVQNALGSSLPAIGYTVTYAVSNILLVIWGLLAVVI